MFSCVVRELDSNLFKNEEVVVFSYTNAGYTDFVINAAKSIAHCASWKFFVFCLDEPSVNVLSQVDNIVPVPFFENLSEKLESHGDIAYKTIVYRKLDIICSLLNSNLGAKYFLYIDSDVVILRDPLPYLTKEVGSTNLMFQCGEREKCSGVDGRSCKYRCTGVIFFQNDRKLIDLFKYSNADPTNPNMDGDQDYIYCVFKNFSFSDKALSTELFPNGSVKNYSEPYLVHYNYMYAKDKQPTMRANGHWFFSETFPEVYRPKIKVDYPPNASELIESYFHKTFISQNFPAWNYLDAFWTNLYVNQDQFGIGYNQSDLQEKIGQLEKGNSFAIVQHDDGIREKLQKNTVVFASGSSRGDIAIPLNYLDVNDSFKDHRNNPKTIFCSFVGSATHGVRNRMVEELSKYPEIELYIDKWSNQVSEERKSLFLEKTSRSVLCLCPRGYGPTSFRFFEALDLGSVPIYIWENVEWLPFRDLIDYSKLAISINVSELPQLYERLKAITPEEIAAKRNYYREVKEHLSLSGIVRRITSFLKGEWGLLELIGNRQRNSQNILYFKIDQAGFGAMISRVMTGLGIALHFKRKVIFEMKGCHYIFPFEGIIQGKVPDNTKRFNFDDRSEDSEWDFPSYWNDPKVRRTFQYPSCPFVPDRRTGSFLNDRWCATLIKYLVLRPIPELNELIGQTKERLGWNSYPRKVGIHIRRGDKGNDCPYVPESVYIDYFRKIKEENLAIFLTSDDPEVYFSFSKLAGNVPILWDFNEKRYNNDNKIIANLGADPARTESLTGAKNILLLGDCDYVIGTYNAQFTWLGGLLCYFNSNFAENRHIMIDPRTHQPSHWSTDY